MVTTPKNIVLGVCGGIAAYKSCELVRLLVKDGCAVQVMMTKAATEFVGALTFQALTGKPVFTDMFSLTQESEIGHIQLADRADLLVIAPATADFLAKAAHGFAEDILSTALLATKAPVVFCPSMNVNMYENQITQRNLKTLRDLGHHFVDPEDGELACGWLGKGRLAEPTTIFNRIKNILK